MAKTSKIILAVTRRVVPPMALAVGIACSLVGPEAVRATVGRVVSRALQSISLHVAEWQLTGRVRQAGRAQGLYAGALDRRRVLAEQLDRLRSAREEVAHRLATERTTLRTIHGILASGAGAGEIVSAGDAEYLRSDVERDLQAALESCIVLERELAGYDVAIARLTATADGLDRRLALAGRGLQARVSELKWQQYEAQGRARVV